MKQLSKVFLFVLFYLVITLNAFAQTEQVKITGLVTQKKDIEIVVVAKIGDRKQRLAQYFLDATNDKFSIVVPFRPEAKYEMLVTVKKMGHIRLEPDYSATFPLQPDAKKNVYITINPGQLNAKSMVVGKQSANFSTAIVNGTLTNWTMGGDVSLEKVVEGHLQKMETIFLEKGNGSFSLLIPIGKEAIYCLSTSRWSKRLYLKPNDQLELTLDGKSGVQTWIKTTDENQLFTQWEQLIFPATGYGYNLSASNPAKLDMDAFTGTHQELQPKITAFLKRAKTSNVKFNALFRTAALLDNSLIAMKSLLYQKGQRGLLSRNPAKEFVNVPPYFKEVIAQNKIRSANLLHFGDGNEYLNLYAKFSLNELDETKRNELGDGGKLKLMMDAIANDTLKAFVLKSQLEELNVCNYSEFRSVFLPQKKYATLPSVKQKYNNLYSQFVTDTAFIGKPANNFTLPDVNGKMVNMGDFKGKVVLIDVWATWCGPCKAQIPHLKKIEEFYKGNNNIVFVGISTDTEKNKQKWLDMVKEKDLEGVQLLDDGFKNFASKYKIMAIPRFLLIDKKGNWSEVRCPLPEDGTKLKKYIDKALQTDI